MAPVLYRTERISHKTSKDALFLPSVYDRHVSNIGSNPTFPFDQVVKQKSSILSNKSITYKPNFRFSTIRSSISTNVGYALFHSWMRASVRFRANSTSARLSAVTDIVLCPSAASIASFTKAIMSLGRMSVRSSIQSKVWRGPTEAGNTSSKFTRAPVYCLLKRELILFSTNCRRSCFDHVKRTIKSPNFSRWNLVSTVS